MKDQNIRFNIIKIAIKFIKPRIIVIMLLVAYYCPNKEAVYK